MTNTFKAVRVERGKSGWGGPLVIEPNSARDKIVAVTGGGIPAVALKLAEMTGGTAVDGFRAPPIESEIAAVVIDCGGTARCGVYPRKRIPTINLTSVGQSGPLAQFITEDIYVSGVKEASLKFADGSEPATRAGAPSSGARRRGDHAGRDPGAGAPDRLRRHGHHHRPYHGPGGVDLLQRRPAHDRSGDPQRPAVHGLRVHADRHHPLHGCRQSARRPDGSAGQQPYRPPDHLGHLRAAVPVADPRSRRRHRPR